MNENIITDYLDYLTSRINDFEYSDIYSFCNDYDWNLSQKEINELFSINVQVIRK